MNIKSREFLIRSLELLLAIARSSSFVRTMHGISNYDLGRISTYIDKLKKNELE